MLMQNGTASGADPSAAKVLDQKPVLLLLLLLNDKILLMGWKAQ
jgi:hypothetical protein